MHYNCAVISGREKIMKQFEYRLECARVHSGPFFAASTVAAVDKARATNPRSECIISASWLDVRTRKGWARVANVPAKNGGARG
jgi:hypothetical protein